MSDKDIIQKVLDNTEVIKRNTTRVEEKNEKLESELDDVEKILRVNDGELK